MGILPFWPAFEIERSWYNDWLLFFFFLK